MFFNKATAQIWANVRVHVFNAGLLARSQFASGRSCSRPNSIKVFLVAEQMDWHPNSTFNCMLHIQLSEW
jgi:hypothetical protein